MSNEETERLKRLEVLLEAALAIIENSEGADQHDQWIPEARKEVAIIRGLRDEANVLCVRDELTRRGVKVCYEYPGYLSLPVGNGWHLNVGTINEFWSGDLSHEKGNTLSGFESDIRNYSRDYAGISNWIVTTLELCKCEQTAMEGRPI